MLEVFQLSRSVALACRHSDAQARLIALQLPPAFMLDSQVLGLTVMRTITLEQLHKFCDMSLHRQSMHSKARQQ